LWQAAQVWVKTGFTAESKVVGGMVAASEAGETARVSATKGKDVIWIGGLPARRVVSALRLPCCDCIPYKALRFNGLYGVTRCEGGGVRRVWSEGVLDGRPARPAALAVHELGDSLSSPACAGGSPRQPGQRGTPTRTDAWSPASKSSAPAASASASRTTCARTRRTSVLLR
jgi:hypothetical protein